MTLPVPNLDDRDVADLLAEAREQIRRSCPEWTDLSVHDPGTALLEAFAHLTKTMIERLNQVPEKAYLSFLNLLGVSRTPPAAAWVDVAFSRTGTDTASAIAIPAGTRVAAAGGVVFVTTEPAELPAGAAEATVRMYHCQIVDGELLGAGTGQPGLVLRAANAPLVATTEPADVVLRVAGETWREVRTFGGTDAQVYLVDRASGTVTFGSRAVPAAGQEIKIWYRTGGGPAGNVAAGTLTELPDPLPGVRVTNPEPARGGRTIESPDEALVRGPRELFAMRRAVTARDFELLATLASSAVARAHAFTRAEVFGYARPGEVEVALVPHVAQGRRTVAALRAHESEEVRQAVAAELDRRRTLGTGCRVTWAHYKPVAVQATVVVHADADAEAVAQRVRERLDGALDAWPFGEPLRASNVYRILEQDEHGVRYVDGVRFTVDEAPDQDVRAVATDQDAWYASAGPVLFRSTNGGLSWEPIGRFPNESVTRVVPAPAPVRPGIVARPASVAVVTRHDEGGSSVYRSTDLGETWRRLVTLDQLVLDVDWDAGGLLAATESGLYDLSGAAPEQVRVDPASVDRGFNAVRTFASDLGVTGVALASQDRTGVWVSIAGGPFRNTGAAGARVLAVQYDGAETVLWAGIAEPDPNKPGSGCQRTRLYAADVRWQSMSSGWTGGTCHALAFNGTTALAATQAGGVLRLDTSAADGGWQGGTGLPMRDRTRPHPVLAIAAVPDSRAWPPQNPPRPAPAVGLAGGVQGVYRSTDGASWTATANRSTVDAVRAPESWLLCSGEHAITVERRDD
jgi:hypothetical protein